jgi:hypothetical protein
MPITRYPYEPGPYSAIFPYEDLVKEEEEKKRKLQEGQQRIMKTNALGDALRLLVDSVGAFKGATVTPKGVNPGIMRASERMRQIQDQSDENLMRYRLTDLANRQKDLGYMQQLEAEQRAAARRANELAQQRSWSVEDQEKEYQFRSGEAEKAGERAVNLENIRSGNTMREIYAREAAKAKEEAIANPFLARYKSVHGNKAPYMAIPDLEMGIEIPLSDTQAALIMKWMRNDPAVSRIEKLNIDPANLTNNLVLKNMVVQHWDRYAPLVRKMASGEKITPQDEQAFYDAGTMTMRIQEYETRRSKIDLTKKKGASQLQQLNNEYKDLFEEPTAIGGGSTINLKPEEMSKIDGILNAEGYSREQKRSAAYSYLIGQGYDNSTAKSLAEFFYSNLN